MNKVKGFRTMLGMTQIEMANELGVSDTTYRTLENNPDKFTLEQINKFLEVVKRVDPSVKAEDIFF
jgi:putative transcriptional regulator